MTSSVLHWAYDDDGNLTSYTDGLSNVTTYTYDHRNRKIERDRPALWRDRLWLRRCRQPDQETDRDGRVRDFTYDDLNRQTAEEWMSGMTVARLSAER